MIKAKKLKVGDKIAIVSLSSGILGEPQIKHQIDLGIKRLNELGLNPVFMPNSLIGIEYVLKNPNKRAEDLKSAFKDDSIKGIICAIGGDDTYKTIPYLMEDQEFISLVKNKPKIFIGFSDSTNNHLMFNKLGLVTYYGLNFLSDLSELQTEMIPYTKESYERFFSDDSYEIVSSPVWYMNRTKYDKSQVNIPLIEKEETKGHEFINGFGKITGYFWGGCLESIYDIYTSERYDNQTGVYERYNLIPPKDFFKDKILFLETSEEKPLPSKFETMLEELIKQNILENVRCLLVGKPYDEVYYSEYRKVLLKISNKLNLPIVYNLNFGHSLPRAVIPYGVRGLVDFDNRRVMITEKIFNLT